MLRKFFGAITDLDGRFWRSIKALLFHPGRIERDYLAGRRAHWLSPVSLFLLANALYFLTPAVTDFALPFHDQMPGRFELAVRAETGPVSAQDQRYWQGRGGQLHAAWTAPLVDARIAARDTQARERGERYRVSDYKRAYDARNHEISKLLLILHVPFFTLGLLMLFPRSGYYYTEHFVVALQLFTFMLLFAQLILLPGAVLWTRLFPDINNIPGWVKTSSLAIVVIYASIAIHRVYRCGWPRASFSGLMMLVVFTLVNIYIYRTLQFLLVFAIS